MQKIVFTSLLASALAVLTACSGAGNASDVQNVTLEAKELAFTPANLEVTAGEPVRLTLQNIGALEHDFSVMGFPIEGEAAEAGGSGHEAGHGEGDEPDLHVAALGGASATLDFTPTKPGTYEFWCTVPGHKEAGMTGTLVVSNP
jgi:uncharacterized cupredoxin-like copper-binding protein